MKHHAKAASAGSTSGRGGGLGSIRRALATRAPSSGADGSGASAQRSARFATGALLTLLVFLLAVPGAFASKEVFNYIGPLGGSGEGLQGAGPFAGEFDQPGDSAVNNTGVGAPAGTAYVVDTRNNRIQRFDADGGFVSAWGKDVIAPTVNERQRLILDADAGTFTLSFNGSTTAPIQAGNATIDDALGALPSIGGDENVSVATPEPNDVFTVIFRGALAAANQPQLTADTTQLSGAVNITTLADGTATTTDTGTGYEVCTVASECKAGVASGENGALDSPQSVAVDGDTGNVYVSDRGNRRVDAYDAAGNFLFSVGRDVAEPDGGTAVEVCEDATDTCRQGDGGSGPGEIEIGPLLSEFDRTLGIAVSPPDGNAATGKIFLADSGNQRVLTYDLDGTSPASFGSSANFGSLQPRKIAVDSRGIVYASNSVAGGEIERYDSQNANGGGTVFLSPIAAADSESQTIHFSGFQHNDSFTLTCPNGDVTKPITYVELASGSAGPNQNNIRYGLEGTCGAGGFTVTGQIPDFTVGFEGGFQDVFGHPSFEGTFRSANQPEMTCTTVVGSGSCAVSAEVDGHPGPLLESPGPLFESIRISGNATTGLAVDPDSDGPGPDKDTLYVLRYGSEAIELDGGGDEGDKIFFGEAQPHAVVEQFGPANDPGLATAPTAADETHGSGAHLSQTGGLGLDEQNNRLLVSGNNNARTIDRVYVLADPASVPAPVLSIDPAVVTGDSTATFSGSVDPKGGLVGCKFQYSTDQISWTDVPVKDCDSLVVGAGTQKISRAVIGLDPGTHYFVRLAVSRPFLPDSTLTSFVKPFDTNPVPPVVGDVGAVQVADVSARLVGTIDPRHSQTGYVFEYGTTPALGSSTAPLAIGAGTKPITVSRVVAGLDPDTTYYFKLLATNAFGSTPSNQKTFHTRTEPFPPASPGNCANQAIRQAQSSTFLPDCRAYEMVSPTDKNQGSALGTATGSVQAAFARDGNGVAFCSAALAGDPSPQQSFGCAPYLARRGVSGWTSKSPFPHYCPFSLDGNAMAFNAYLPRQSFDRIALEVPELESSCNPIDPAAPQSSLNLYREDLTTDPFDFNLLTPENSGNGLNPVRAAWFAGGSDDFSHIVYASFTNQTADSPVPEERSAKLYDWEEEGHGACVTPGGCLSLLSVDPNGDPFTTASKLPGYSFGVADTPIPSAVSGDGNRIYFENETLNNAFPARMCDEPSCDLYMRENDETTFHVSASECTVACGVDSAPDQFRWANPSGDIALFISCAKLTDASSPAAVTSGNFCGHLFTKTSAGKLYRWDRNGAPGHRLVDLSVDQEPADGNQPHAVEVIGASDDGNTVYFVAAGQLVSGAPTGKISGTELKLYRWSWNGGSPHLDYLSPYLTTWVNGTTSTDEDLENSPDGDFAHVRVTPDGKYLVIQTKLALDPAADRDSDVDLYRWDQADGWLCVSCQLPGVPSAGPVSSVEPRLDFNGVIYEYVSEEPEHTISDDGRRIFFSTPDALVPQDVNGDAGCDSEKVRPGGRGTLYSCADVYEWHDGTVSLLSSGTGTKPFTLIGATHTGDDVFFATAQRMVGWDVDNGVDIYDARSGGGFPEPPPAPPICEGAEQCHGAGTSAPPVTGAGTAVFEGPGNPAPKHATAPKHNKKRHHKRAQKHRQRAADHNRRAGR